MKISLVLAVAIFSAATMADDRYDGSIRILPDPILTPGANDPSNIDPSLTPDVLCAPGFTTKSIRNVPESMAKQVYENYQVQDHQGYCSDVEDGTNSLKGCEVDHLCSLELGCRNTVGNLWIEPYGGTRFNAHIKDKLENFLHKYMCDNPDQQHQIQIDISTNWKDAYEKYIGPIP